MFQRHKNRRKKGKDHRYGSIGENQRVADVRVVQQRAAWSRRTLQVVNDVHPAPTQGGHLP